jgi:hypothetical protein
MSMKVVLAFAALAGLMTMSLQARATIVTVDQQNTVNPTLVGYSGAGSAVGETFVPTLDAVDGATFSLISDGGTVPVYLEILSGFSGDNGLGGTVLGTSAAVNLTNTAAFETIEFDLTSPVALTPGDTYVLAVVSTSGSFNFESSSSSTYVGQQVQGIYSYADILNEPLIFTEGLTGPAPAPVPEPPAWAVLGLGLLGLGYVRNRVAG